jgi:hypothetical protein
MHGMFRAHEKDHNTYLVVVAAFPSPPKVDATIVTSLVCK